MDSENIIDYLFRNEILFNYFNRKMPKVRKRGIRIPHRFKGRGNKEQVILTHSVYNLRDKGLITIHNGFYTGWQGYRLTPKGIEVAKSLIVNTEMY